MEQKRLRLLIHHHDIAYCDDNGIIWLSANIGRWVDAISTFVDELGLLLYQSSHQLPSQDTPVDKANVTMFSLGPRKTVFKRWFRANRLRQVCVKAGANADILLVRGITPHQFPVWQFTPVEKKAFLLVESLRLRTLPIAFSLKNTILNLLGRYRLLELRSMAKDNPLMLANSPVSITEIEKMFKTKAHFVPTSSIWRSEFAPLKIRAISKPYILLYVGRLDFRKGLRELIHAIALLRQQGQLSRLVIVGDMLDPVYSKLVLLANQLGVHGLIDWRGKVPFGQELFDIYQSADVFVLPSYSEGFPKAIREAMANCCPVVTTSVGGIPALIKDQEHALLIPPKDVGAIVLAVERLLSDNDLRSCMIRDAYHYALNYSVEACSKMLVDTLLKELKWKL